MLNFTITKQIDLINNDGLSSINNHAAQQHHCAYEVFYDLLGLYPPKRILEIGTALGGFTKFLDLATTELKLNTYIKSYDIHRMLWYDSMINNKLEINVTNIFSADYKNLINNSVIDFIQQAGLTIVLCDGGSKKNEFNILSKYLKNNDIIMTHDYSPTKEYFIEHMKNKIWNWHEIEDNDIIESMALYNLTKHEKYEELLSVAWGCFTKE